MDVNLRRSIDRAIHLMGTPVDYENYLSIKIRPVPRSCCCFHCWPGTWAVINDYISPCGPLEDEGDVLIDKNNARFVLECHESGPEIIIYIWECIEILATLNFIVDLIKKFLETRQHEVKQRATYKITKRRLIKAEGDNFEANEENIKEISIPISDDIVTELSESIRSVFEQRK